MDETNDPSNTLYIDGISRQAFKKPLEEDANGPAKMVTKDDVRLMFSEIPVMVLYSNQLITDLENNVMKNWNDHIKIGTIFLKMVCLKGCLTPIFENSKPSVGHSFCFVDYEVE